MRIVFMDARTKRGNYRFTVFAETVEELIREYQAWVKEGELSQKDIWYANIFDSKTSKHLGYATIGEEYEIRTTPVKDSKLSPYHKSLKQLVDFFR